MATTGAPVEYTTAAAAEEKSKLQKHFGRFDMLLLPDLHARRRRHARGGRQQRAEGFTWLIFLAVFFFVPYAFLTAELGAAFTGEGGCYVWTRLAFGRFVAGINTVLYWLSNPVWMGGLLCITASTTFNTFFGDLGTRRRPLYASARLIWFGVWAAILSFGVGKWIPTLGAWAASCCSGSSRSASSCTRSRTACSAGGRRLQADLRAVHRARPVALLQLRRLRAAQRGGRRDEGPAARRAVHGAARLTIAAVLLYGIPILAILMVLPSRRSPASAASSTR